MHEALAGAARRMEVTGSLAAALEVVRRSHVDVAFVDPRLDRDGSLSAAIRRNQTTPRTLLVRVADGDLEATLEDRPRRADATLRAGVDAAEAAALLDRLLPPLTA